MPDLSSRIDDVLVSSEGLLAKVTHHTGIHLASWILGWIVNKNLDKNTEKLEVVDRDHVGQLPSLATPMCDRGIDTRI